MALSEPLAVLQATAPLVVEDFLMRAGAIKTFEDKMNFDRHHLLHRHLNLYLLHHLNLDLVFVFHLDALQDLLVSLNLNLLLLMTAPSLGLFSTFH
eukprot:g6355.t1